MKGDFSRYTFDKARHFSRVLMQQGRVQLDADWNENTEIVLHYLRTLAADLIGPFAGPKGDGFMIKPEGNDFKIGRGRYYVDGILCENEGTANNKDFAYSCQPHYPLTPDKDKLPTGSLLVYLDVWERYLTYIETESADGSVIGIRDVALGGPDTATRTQVVWQVKTTGKTPDDSPRSNSTWRSWVDNKWSEWTNQWQPTNRGMLKAQARREQEKDTEPCTASPESRYRGAENQLYRVEIHRGSSVGNGDKPTFKWSRDNGSVVFPIRTLTSNEVTLEHLGRDERWGLKRNDWVEIVDDHMVLRDRVGRLAQVDEIDLAEQTVTLKGDDLPEYQEDDTRHPLLRRWDQRANEQDKEITNGVPIKEGPWRDLEDGVQICFEPGSDKTPPSYRPGDYWLIPARTATGDVEWPGPVGDRQARRPHGIEHHYAPLAIILVDAKSGITETVDLRNEIKPPVKP